MTNSSSSQLSVRITTRIALGVICAIAALFGPALAPANAASLQQTLIASGGEPDDHLGSVAAIDGDTAVLGAPAADDGRGAVYVFTRSGDAWAQTGKLTASDGEAGDVLGDSVAIDGDTIIAGAPHDDVFSSTDQGSVYTFARTGAAARTETAKLYHSVGETFDGLGNSVAIDGDTIVAGASSDDYPGKSNQGSVYAFARTGAAVRIETATLSASDGEAGDILGYSVAIEGDTIIAGAVVDDTAQGSVYTFARTGAAARTETAKLTAADGEASDFLGYSVAIDGDTIVAGAPFDDAGFQSDRGSAYTFARTGAPARTETAKLTASDGEANDSLGFSVAIDADTIVAGVPTDTVGANGTQGSARVFAGTGPAAHETGTLTASDGAADDRLGSSVAIDGDAVVAGARLDNVGASMDQGSATLFYEPTPPPESPDTDADGVADADDVCPSEPGPVDNQGCPKEEIPEDTMAPETMITNAPKRKTAKGKTKLAFSSSEQGSVFTCKLDKKPAKPCSSPSRAKRLKPGKHRFSVYATDPAGNSDLTPAKVRWMVRLR